MSIPNCQACRGESNYYHSPRCSAQFLNDLADRIFLNCPAIVADEGDVQRLREIAAILLEID